MATSATHPTSPLLEARGIGVVYGGGLRALHPTHLRIAPGEFVVLLGPSGAGKSTLLRTLNGLVEPTEGEVWMRSLGIARDRKQRRALRRQVAMVFQQHQLIGRLTALANVLTGRLGFHSGLRTLFPLPRADRQIALEALERVGLIQHALRRCDQLSGGQQQRVGVARALAQQPQIMLADEPVASLDPANAAHILSLLREVCRSGGIAAVVSLHQVPLARRFADRIVGIANGTVVFDGPASALDVAALARIYGNAAATGADAPFDERAEPIQTGALATT
ncbi:MAG: phosphonate ABC transporter ATP-binding protein [Burkholderiales bacterium]|nr:phosphonate ABC transporter ATP-binding protein [Burkholderiales bacterium]